MIKVFIAEDHNLVREGIAKIVNSFAAVEVIGLAENGAVLLEQIQNQQPDIILMDLNMPVMDGFEATKQIGLLYPEIKVLGLTQHNEERFIVHLIKLGGSGCLLKNTSPDELEMAIHEVMKKGYYLNDSVSLHMFKGLKRNYKFKIQFAGDFQEVERQILLCMCRGMKTDEIAEEINKSPRTIENYRRSMISKAGAKNSIGLVLYALKNGIIEMEEIAGFDHQ